MIDERDAGVGTARRDKAGSGLLRTLAHRLAGDPIDLPFEGRLASFDGATGWLNSEALTPESLRGRVVAVDFWTYTCINWLRTLPYRRAWDAKYRDAGLTIVGAHTPEFGFEHDVANVTKYVERFGVRWPVAIDSDYGVWRAFANHFWPALYIADTEGRIRYHHFGEGEYAMSEMVIQQLLIEAGADIDPELSDVNPEGLEVAADWRTLRSPESYLGYNQGVGFASPESGRPDVPSTYSLPADLGLNTWALAGAWTLAGHASISGARGSTLAFRFQARDVNLVMGPAAAASPVPYQVRIDGVVPGDAHGDDVDAAGKGDLDEQRTYQLIRQPGAVRERTFEIEFLGPGAEAYCFTFG
jgi:thioredoxin family protein